MPTIVVLTIVLVCSVFAVYDGNIDWPVSAGTATPALRGGALALWGNPATASSQGWSGAVFASREWGLDELTTISIAGARDFAWGSCALGGSFFGSSDLYSETSAGAVYALKYREIHAGVKVGFLSASGGNWNATAPLFSAGAMFTANDAVELHAWADNITASKLDGNDIPVRGTVAVVFKPTDWARLAFDLYSQSPHRTSIRFGQEAFILDVLKLRCGVAFMPNTYHLGIGIRVRDFEFDWAYVGHPELGGSTQLGLIYMR